MLICGEGGSGRAALANLSMTTGQDVTVLSRGLQLRGSPMTMVMQFYSAPRTKSVSTTVL